MNEERGGLLYPALLALVLVGGLYLLQGRIDWNPADEGYQWYGAVQTAHGRVPLRDFASYEPGRYLWSAAWSKLLGPGLVALRLSTSIFAGVSLFFGLLAAGRAFDPKTAKTVRRLGLALMGLVLTLWLQPRYKLFEPAWAMTAVWFAVRLLERPTLRRHLAAGVFVGLASFLGKNHLLYCGAAFFALIVFERLWLERRERESPSLFARLGASIGGIGLGALPIALMCLFVPGFFVAYRSSFYFFLQQKRTNFPLPIPWPWRHVEVGQVLDTFGALGRFALGVGFLALPVFALLFAAFAFGTNRENAPKRHLLLAAGFVGLFYMHHALARADPFHFAECISPLLLALFALPRAVSGPARATRRTAAVAAVAAFVAFITLFVAIPQTPYFRYRVSLGFFSHYEPYEIAGDRIWVPFRAKTLYGAIRWEVGRHLRPDEPLLVVPHLPGIYPLLGRESPVWDIYPIWPSAGERDERMLRELRQNDVRWALVDTYEMDGRPELRFDLTHPKTAAYLRAEFVPVQGTALSKKLSLLHRKDPVTAQ